MPARGRSRSSATLGEQLQGRDHRGHPATSRLALPPGRVRRPLPRAARAGDRPPRAFKLTSVAGAYWRGDARNEHAPAHLRHRVGDQEGPRGATSKRVEEAKQRDHRRLGQELDLFSLHPIAPGSPFFHPKGAIVYNTLVDYIRRLYGRYGYTEVITPLIYKTRALEDARATTTLSATTCSSCELDDDEYGVKPMNCPGHCYLFATRKHSYRDLPIRYADFSRLHRFEPSGTLHGLTRVRSIAQDDAHIYCTPEQVDDELDALHRDDARGLRRVRLRPRRGHAADAAREVPRPDRAVGRGRGGARARRSTRRGYPVTSCPARARSTARRSASTSATCSSARGRSPRCRSTARMPERFGLAT